MWQYLVRPTKPTAFPILLALALLCTTMATAQDLPDPGPSFELESVIEVDSTLLLAGIDDLDVRDDALLLTDARGGGAYLLTSDGRLVRSLSAASCRPGRSLSPTAARFTREGIVLASLQTPYMRFTGDGTCVGPLNKRVLSAPLWDAFDDGSVAAFNFRHSAVMVYAADGLNTKTIAVREPRYPELELSYGGGGIRIVADTIWAVGVVPDVLVSVGPGGTVRAEPIESSVLRYPGSPDLPAGSFETQAEDLGKVMEDATLTNRLFALSDEVFLLRYQSKRSTGYVLLGHDGREIESHPSQAIVLYAADSRLYVLDEPQSGPAGEISNPRILVYRYTR